MKISKAFSFEAAHRLQNHDGKCRRLHGHSYKVEVTVEGSNELPDSGSKAGMLLDFGWLDDWWAEQDFDHRTILDEDDPLAAILSEADDGAYADSVLTLPFPPTAERFALLLHYDLQNWLGRHTHGGLIASVRVWETAKSWAEA